MITINFEKKYIFFHIPKCAGTYIQKALTKYNFFCYKYFSRYDTDELILNSNFLQNNSKDINSINFINSYYTKKIGIQKYFSCSSIFLKLTNLNETKWEELYKFTFVRNPYDRFISGWNFVINADYMKNKIINNEKYTLEDMEKFKNVEYTIQNKEKLTHIAYNHIFVTQYEHILDKNNKNNMDFIGKMENLENDLEYILNKMGFTEIVHEKDKKINETKHNNYKEYYNQTILDFVNQWFHKDFIEFGYQKYNTMEEFINS